MFRCISINSLNFTTTESTYIDFCLLYAVLPPNEIDFPGVDEILVHVSIFNPPALLQFPMIKDAQLEHQIICQTFHPLSNGRELEIYNQIRGQ